MRRIWEALILTALGKLSSANHWNRSPILGKRITSQSALQMRPQPCLYLECSLVRDTETEDPAERGTDS